MKKELHITNLKKKKFFLHFRKSHFRKSHFNMSRRDNLHRLLTFIKKILKKRKIFEIWSDYIIVLYGKNMIISGCIVQVHQKI